MNLQNRIHSFTQLGFYIKSRPEELEQKVRFAGIKNHWFTAENCFNALEAIANLMLEQEKLESWIKSYPEMTGEPKIIGIIAAGNIPLVSFHDILCVLMSGNIALIKLSEKDNVLPLHLLNVLKTIAPEWENFIHFEDRWAKFDAVIATGSNNTGRYFEQYFGKYPHIIRKNRHSIAVLTGNESEEELLLLGKDAFDYFGLGCRNVSMLWLPENYDFRILIEAWKPFQNLMMHNTYKNNLDYQRTLYLMSNTPLIDCDFVNMVPHASPASPVSCLHFQHYQDVEEVRTWANEHVDEIQCIINLSGFTNSFGFGEAQHPGLMDYADGIDTVAFLQNL